MIRTGLIWSGLAIAAMLATLVWAWSALPAGVDIPVQPIVAFQKRQKRRRTTIAINQSEARKVQPRLKENTHFALRLLLLIDNKAKKRDRRPGSTTTTPLYLFIALFATLIQLSFSA